MLTSQSNTQVYSLFGSYVLEQHGTGNDAFRGHPERGRPCAEPPAQHKDLPKAA